MQTDLALVKDGVIVALARNTDNLGSFGPEPDGDLVSFASGAAVPGMLWDGATLSSPPPEPAPYVRRLILKSVVQERAHALGKLAPILAILRSEGQEINYARWFAPDWPRVYFDDPAMLALLEAVGCTEAQIAEITAP